MSNAKHIDGLKYQPDRFVSLANARSFAAGASKPCMVMLGDDGRFWVVVMADAARLNDMGYEFAE